MIRHWIVLRHAHAEAQSADGTDFSRELTERGRTEAQRAADALAAMLDGRVPRIVSSPAARAEATAQIVAERLGDTVGFNARIYEATPGNLLDVFNATGPTREIDWYSPTSRPLVLGCEAASTTVNAPSRSVEKQAPQAKRASNSGQNVGVSPYIAVVMAEPTPAATTGPRPPIRLNSDAARPFVTSRTIRFAPSSTPTDHKGSASSAACAGSRASISTRRRSTWRARLRAGTPSFTSEIWCKKSSRRPTRCCSSMYSTICRSRIRRRSSRALRPRCERRDA